MFNIAYKKYKKSCLSFNENFFFKACDWFGVARGMKIDIFSFIGDKVTFLSERIYYDSISKCAES